MTLGKIVDDEGTDNFSDLGKSMKKYTVQDEPYVLDIDLDFFSTRNPFLSLYEKANAYKRLQNLYCFPENGDVDLDTSVTRRKQQLCELQNFFSHLSIHQNLDNLPTTLNSSSYLAEV